MNCFDYLKTMDANLDIQKNQSELKRRKPRHCPNCNFNSIARIAYGPGIVLREGESHKDVVAGGCVIVIPGEIHWWCCKLCGFRF